MVKRNLNFRRCHTKQFFVQSFSQHLSPTVNTPYEDIAVNIFLP